MTSKIYPHFVRDTEITLFVRKVSPNTLLDFQKDFEKKNPEPTAPNQKVNLGTETEPEWREEPNPTDPDYKAALSEYKTKASLAQQLLLITEGIVYELTDEDRKEVAAYRERYKARTDEELQGSDLIVFVKYIALGTSDDMKELVQAITRRTLPTEDATREQLKSL